VRRLFQFRLRTLFVLVAVAAIAALWWSHRLHCLDRAEFHRAEIARCREQQLVEKEAFIAAFFGPISPRRRLPSGEFAIDSFIEQIAFECWKAETMMAKLETQQAEIKSIQAEFNEKLRTAMQDQSRLGADGLGLGASSSQRWEDQSVYDSMAQGFLVVPAPGASMYPRRSEDSRERPPSATTNLNPGEPDALADSIVPVPEPPNTVEKVLDEPDLVPPYEAKVAALSREIVIHAELADKYLRAINRPWLHVDESALSEAKGP
jgi:hypothetical protein